MDDDWSWLSDSDVAGLTDTTDYGSYWDSLNAGGGGGSNIPYDIPTDYGVSGADIGADVMPEWATGSPGETSFDYYGSPETVQPYDPNSPTERQALAEEALRESEMARLGGVKPTRGDVEDWAKSLKGAGLSTSSVARTLRDVGGMRQESPTVSGALSSIGKKLASGDLNAWLTLLGGGAKIYGSMQQSKAAQEAAKQSSARAAANQAQFNAPLPSMQYQRQQLAAPQDLLTAGMRPGGVQWFTPGSYVPKAKGGSVDEVDDGWLNRVMQAIGQRKPAPALVGSGSAAKAGEQLMSRPYQIYRTLQESTGEPAMSYEEWVVAQRRGGMARGGGLERLVRGSSGGQEDDVNARLSHGEYVFDADSVSALGDGNNEAGAAKLDEMRRRLRAHKRKAPPTEIPPKAKKPEQYLPKK